MLKIKSETLHLTDDRNDITEFSANIAAAICFIQAENKILLLKNHPDANKPYLREWGTPGGKLEKNEDPLDAVHREIYEETSLSIDKQNLKYLCRLFARIPNFDYELYVYQTTINKPISELSIALDNREHSHFAWYTIAEALQLPLIEGDKELIEHIYEN